MGKDKILKDKFERRKQAKKYTKNLKKDPKFLKTLPVVIQKDISLLKYWFNRFRLFKKFDEGIELDRGKLSTYKNNNSSVFFLSKFNACHYSVIAPGDHNVIEL